RHLAESAPPGITVLDTCFSHRAGTHLSGEMNLLVGGDTAEIERFRGVFNALATEVFQLGGVGAGRSVKLINNLLWVANIQAASDALALAAKLGFDPNRTAEIVQQCTGSSDVLTMFTRPYEDLLVNIRRFMTKDA